VDPARGGFDLQVQFDIPPLQQYIHEAFKQEVTWRLSTKLF